MIKDQICVLPRLFKTLKLQNTADNTAKNKRVLL